jgi:hypothetical protein
MGRDWLQTAVAILKREIGRQILPDGGPAEQSLAYHRFVLDLYWLVVDFLARNSLADCSELVTVLTAGENFYASFQDFRGDLPGIGDSDDGYAIAPGITPSRPEVVIPEAGIRTFPISGYTTIRCRNGGLFTYDHGPLGMPPLFNHGHADALSITLSLNGEKVLVDPGTYRYNGVPEWRKYFKGTRAHNTVTIDGSDQAVQETGFIWSHPYATETLRRSETESGFLIEARHNGYTKLKPPVTHKRSVLFSDESVFIIKDTFSGEGIHEFELNFHLHPDCVAEESNGVWSVTNGNGAVSITLFSSGDFRHLSGLKDPPLGWYSPAYGIKQQCGVLQAVRNGSPHETTFVTGIWVTQGTDFETVKKSAATL